MPLYHQSARLIDDKQADMNRVGFESQVRLVLQVENIRCGLPACRELDEEPGLNAEAAQ
jgi:hypothetical protein